MLMWKCNAKIPFNNANVKISFDIAIHEGSFIVSICKET